MQNIDNDSAAREGFLNNIRYLLAHLRDFQSRNQVNQLKNEDQQICILYLKTGTSNFYRLHGVFLPFPEWKVQVLFVAGWQ